MRYPYILSLVVLYLTIFNSCTHTSSKSVSPNTELLVVQDYVNKFGSITSPTLEDYFKRLVAHLVSYSHQALAQPPKILLLNSDSPLAFCAGTEYIVISKALLCALSSEDELAFVIAHELGHQNLKHYNNSSVSVEFEADQFAVITLVNAKYNVYKALSIFHRFPLLHTNNDAEGSTSIVQRSTQAAEHLEKNHIFHDTYTSRRSAKILQSLCN